MLDKRLNSLEPGCLGDFFVMDEVDGALIEFRLELLEGGVAPEEVTLFVGDTCGDNAKEEVGVKLLSGSVDGVDGVLSLVISFF